VLPDVGRISREELRILGSGGQGESPASDPRRSRVRATTIRHSASQGAIGAGRVLGARRWITAHVTGENLSVGGASLARASEGQADFAQLVNDRAGGSERQLREALRLPPTANRPVNVQVRVAEAASAAPGQSLSTGALGIRRLVARGSGAVAVRQQRDQGVRRREVLLPNLNRTVVSREATDEPARAQRTSAEQLREMTLRQRLEEQENRLQEQLQEQAELQHQLQQHLEQEQQLQRELREQLERDLEDLNQLEELVGVNTGSESGPSPRDEAEEVLAISQPSDTLVQVPGVGPMQRRQLANLQALLNGADEVATGANPDLPDLSGLSSAQLEQLEAQLSRGLGVQAAMAGTSAATASEGPASVADVPRPPTQANAAEEATPEGHAAELPAHTEAAPTGNPEVLNHEAATPARMPPEMMMREATGQNPAPWHVKEAAFEALLVKAVPKAECSICCDWLDGEVVMLPCQARGCRSYFHAECIRPWLSRNPSCPLCRESVPELVRPATPPLPSAATGHPLLDLWFLAMAMQRQERENVFVTRARQTASPSLADLQGVVFTASALVELLGNRLGFSAEVAGGNMDDSGPSFDTALQAMLAGGDGVTPLAREVALGAGAPAMRPVNSFQEQILRSAAAIDATVLQSSPDQQLPQRRP